MKSNVSNNQKYGINPVEEQSCMPVAYSLELQRIIEYEAFLLAEKDGFKRSPLDYWLVAEGRVYQTL